MQPNDVRVQTVASGDTHTHTRQSLGRRAGGDGGPHRVPCRTEPRSRGAGPPRAGEGERVSIESQEGTYKHTRRQIAILGIADSIGQSSPECDKRL